MKKIKLVGLLVCILTITSCGVVKKIGWVKKSKVSKIELKKDSVNLHGSNSKIERIKVATKVTEETKKTTTESVTIVTKTPIAEGVDNAKLKGMLLDIAGDFGTIKQNVDTLTNNIVTTFTGNTKGHTEENKKTTENSTESNKEAVQVTNVVKVVDNKKVDSTVLDESKNKEVERFGIAWYWWLIGGLIGLLALVAWVKKKYLK